MRHTFTRAATLLALVCPLAVPATATGQTSAPALDTPVVTVTRLANRRALIEVKNDDVMIRKEVGADASHTTIATPTDELQLRVTRGQLVVSSPSGTVSMAQAGPDEMARLLAVLQRSSAAARGRELLRQVPASPNKFGHQALLLTRAILELAQGSSPALASYREWVGTQRQRLETRPARPLVTKIQSAGQDRGPGECWDLYAAEAIRIADDFAECTDGLNWYDALGWSGCSVIYTVRAEGALFWFMSCSGGFPFSG
jgi:hypothetical protein